MSLECHRDWKMPMGIAFSASNASGKNLLSWNGPANASSRSKVSCIWKDKRQTLLKYLVLSGHVCLCLYLQWILLCSWQWKHAARIQSTQPNRTSPCHILPPDQIHLGVSSRDGSTVGRCRESWLNWRQGEAGSCADSRWVGRHDLCFSLLLHDTPRQLRGGCRWTGRHNYSTKICRARTQKTADIASQ